MVILCVGSGITYISYGIIKNKEAEVIVKAIEKISYGKCELYQQDIINNIRFLNCVII